MLRRILFPLILGAGGVGVLLWLGFWQLHRLEWKEAKLVGIEAMLSAPAVPLPATVTEDADEYRAVMLSGAATGEELHMLDSGTAAGTGYRVISAFLTSDGRRILMDQGLLPLDAPQAAPSTQMTKVDGNLLWPDDKTSATPPPDLAKNIWFARNVTDMAQALSTEPLMVVARRMSVPDPRLTLLPVDTSNISNNHWQYAITWFLMAAMWAVMAAFLVFRTLRPKDV